MKIPFWAAVLLLPLGLPAPSAQANGGDSPPVCTIYPCMPEQVCSAGDTTCLQQRLREARVALGQLKVKSAQRMILSMKGSQQELGNNTEEFRRALAKALNELQNGNTDRAKQLLLLADRMVKERLEEEAAQNLAEMFDLRTQPNQGTDIIDCSGAGLTAVQCSQGSASLELKGPQPSEGRTEDSRPQTAVDASTAR